MDIDEPRSASYGVSISKLIRFARASSRVTDFNARNKILTAKLFYWAIGIINSNNFFLNFIADAMNWFLN